MGTMEHVPSHKRCRLGTMEHVPSHKKERNNAISSNMDLETITRSEENQTEKQNTL